MKSYLIVFLISMVPLIELRGAIPYAVGFGIPLVPAYIIAIIGNMLPVPFIYFFARKVLEWGKDKPVLLQNIYQLFWSRIAIVRIEKVLQTQETS